MFINLTSKLQLVGYALTEKALHSIKVIDIFTNPPTLMSNYLRLSSFITFWVK